MSTHQCQTCASRTDWNSGLVRNSGISVYAMHAQACDVAFMRTFELMFPMVRKSGCISISLVIWVTGALSDARIIGTIVVPSGS